MRTGTERLSAEIGTCVWHTYRAICSRVRAEDRKRQDPAVTLLQDVSFMLFSDVFTPNQITEVLGVEPSMVRARMKRTESRSDHFGLRTNPKIRHQYSDDHTGKNPNPVLISFSPMCMRLNRSTGFG